MLSIEVGKGSVTLKELLICAICVTFKRLVASSDLLFKSLSGVVVHCRALVIFDRSFEGGIFVAGGKDDIRNPK